MLLETENHIFLRSVSYYSADLFLAVQSVHLIRSKEELRYQYTLNTTSFEEQPLNDCTLGRFRARCNSYEEMTGVDLIHDCIIKLSLSMATMMKLNAGMRRMDSLMVASNIKKMRRLELLYTCVANLCKLMKKLENPAFSLRGR